MMRKLFFALVIAAAAWSGYWWVGATAQETALKTWLDQRREAGWVANRSDLQVTGYPNRFDSIIRDLELADPVSGWSWSAPEFQILALSYAPNHIIAAWPPTQTVASPQERVDISSDRMRGSVRFEVDTQLALQQTVIELQNVAAVSTAGWRAALAKGQLAIRQSTPGTAPDFGYDVSLSATDVTLPEPVKRLVDPASLLPPSVAAADVRMTPVFDAKWDRTTIEGPKPNLMTLNVQNLSFSWGEMEMTVTGRLDADALGYAEGELKVIARNWREMIEVGVHAGWIPDDMAGTLETGLGLFAQLTGDANRLDVPLTFSGGQARLGPIPVGRAPIMN